MPLAFAPRPTITLFSSNFLSNATRGKLLSGCSRTTKLSFPSRSSTVRMMSSSTGPPSSETEFVAAFATAPSDVIAQKLATSIVENKLAACVNTIPNIVSTYWWDGKVQREPEVLLMMKTRAALVPELTEHVRKEHPYDVPELIIHAIVAGNPDYLTWIAASTRGPKS